MRNFVMEDNEVSLAHHLCQRNNYFLASMDLDTIIRKEKKDVNPNGYKQRLVRFESGYVQNSQHKLGVPYVVNCLLPVNKIRILLPTRSYRFVFKYVDYPSNQPTVFDYHLPQIELEFDFDFNSYVSKVVEAENMIDSTIRQQIEKDINQILTGKVYDNNKKWFLESSIQPNISFRQKYLFELSL